MHIPTLHMMPVSTVTGTIALKTMLSLGACRLSAIIRVTKARRSAGGGVTAGQHS